MLAVLIQGGGTNGLEFTTSQQGLQNTGSVNSSFCCSCAHQGVDLINEDDDVASRTNLFGDFLQTLFEVSAVATTRNQGTQVQGVELLVLEGFGNVTFDNGLGKTLDHGRLSHTGFTDQDRVVLGTSRQNLHDPFHFALAANHRIEFSIAGCLGEVAAKLIEHG